MSLRAVYTYLKTCIRINRVKWTLFETYNNTNSKCTEREIERKREMWDYAWSGVFSAMQCNSIGKLFNVIFPIFSLNYSNSNFANKFYSCFFDLMKIKVFYISCIKMFSKRKRCKKKTLNCEWNGLHNGNSLIQFIDYFIVLSCVIKCCTNKLREIKCKYFENHFQQFIKSRVGKNWNIIIFNEFFAATIYLKPQ